MRCACSCCRRQLLFSLQPSGSRRVTPLARSVPFHPRSTGHARGRARTAPSAGPGQPCEPRGRPVQAGQQARRGLSSRGTAATPAAHPGRAAAPCAPPGSPAGWCPPAEGQGQGGASMHGAQGSMAWRLQVAEQQRQCRVAPGPTIVSPNVLLVFMWASTRATSWGSCSRSRIWPCGRSGRVGVAGGTAVCNNSPSACSSCRWPAPTCSCSDSSTCGQRWRAMRMRGDVSGGGLPSKAAAAGA